MNILTIYYKLGYGFITNWSSFVLLQIGASVITDWGSLVITKWGRRYYKLGQLLQIRATVITNLGSYYKLGQTLLQIRAAITNWGITPSFSKISQPPGSNQQMVNSVAYHLCPSRLA